MAVSRVSRPPRIAVRVTKHEIDTAVACNSGHCMIADAVKRSYFEKYGEQPEKVAVDVQTVRLTDRKRRVRYVYLTPRVGQKALVQFDQGIKPTEFNFRLNSGQVIHVKDKVSPAKRSKAQEAQTTLLHKKQQSKKATLEIPKSSSRPDRTTGLEYAKVGGKAPPKAALAGNRRQFGIKSLGDLNGPTQ